ncbi:hypothetical protein QBC35DRAFT_467971 [Podospora australis]|uniref:Retrotransposon gag domain-containing protein n=1 Tax=Podospora australis TaxID=1536484 RepID=A0AAN6WJ67_9PEZI|nr:hypothetical protein QBC35DRAFT_467971 [Podospora australis]
MDQQPLPTPAIPWSVDPTERPEQFTVAIQTFSSLPANRTPEAMFSKLRSAYGKPELQKARGAGQCLLTVNQGLCEPIQAFITRFEEILYRANAHVWPDAAKIVSLLVSLNNTWRTRIAERTDIPQAHQRPQAGLADNLIGNRTAGDRLYHLTFVGLKQALIS